MNIRVQLFRLISDTEWEPVFDMVSDEQGRLSQTVQVPGEQTFELVLHSRAYFENRTGKIDGSQNMPTVVIRFSMKERQQRYHIPIVLSPHSYTVWWSR